MAHNLGEGVSPEPQSHKRTKVLTSVGLGFDLWDYQARHKPCHTSVTGERMLRRGEREIKTLVPQSALPYCDFP